MKVKISVIDENHLRKLKESQLIKLSELKSKGLSKEELIKKFTKRFVDENY